MVKNGQKWSKNGQSVQVGTAYKTWSQHLFSMRKVSSKPILTKNSSAAPKLLLNSMIHSPNGVVGRRALSPRQGARKDPPHGRRWTARDLPSGSALSGHAQSGHTPTRPHPFTPPPLNQALHVGSWSNQGGPWWWVGVQAEQAPFDELTLLSPEEEQSLFREQEPPGRRRAGNRGLSLLHACPTSRPCPRMVRPRLSRCRRGSGK